jgi:hypothetical protein
MKSPDLSVIVTAHAETIVAGPTMRSAEAAIAQAEAAGFTVERLLAFDTPSDACRAFFSQYTDWRTLHFDFRDQGRTRNAALAEAAGRWAALLDGDDLFSVNWLSEALYLLHKADRMGCRIIVHPELNWIFDAGEFVFRKPAQSEELYSSYYMATANYYDALSVAPRSVWMQHPFPDRDIGSGFAYEDWQWNIETAANGWAHCVAPDTIIFKRRRDHSQTHESRGHSACIRALAETSIDRIRLFGIESEALASQFAISREI